MPTNLVSGNGAFNRLTSFLSKHKALPQCSKKGTLRVYIRKFSGSTAQHYNYKLHFPILYSMNVPGQIGQTIGSLQPFRPLP